MHHHLRTGRSLTATGWARADARGYVTASGALCRHREVGQAPL